MLAQLKPYGYDINARFDQLREAKWNDYFQQLVEYKEKVGHLRVSVADEETRKLSRWINQQRQKYEDKRLTEEKERRLRDIGFVFICIDCYHKKKRFTKEQETKWNEMFGKLCRYKEEHGHCEVPFTYEQCPELSHWVSRQRDVFNNGKMDGSRRNRLDEIGFTWTFF